MQGFKSLFNYLALLGQEISGEKPWEAIELRSLDRGRPDLRMLVAEKHMTFIKLNGAGERALDEIRAGETELGVGRAGETELGVGCTAVATGEQTLVS